VWPALSACRDTYLSARGICDRDALLAFGRRLGGGVAFDDRLLALHGAAAGGTKATAPHSHGSVEVLLVAAIVDQCSRRCALLFVPLRWIRGAVELAPYRFFVEWLCWSVTFGLMGNAIAGVLHRALG
jgi:hypothetical protein